MRLAKALKSQWAALLGGGFVLALILLFYVDRGSFAQLKDLADRLRNSDKTRLEAVLGEKGADILKPLAEQVSARRDDLIESAQRLANDAQLKIALGPASKLKAAEVLLRMATARGNAWTQIELIDAKGKLVAVWPEGPAGRDYAGSDIFKALSDKNTAPGIPTFDFLKTENVPGKDNKKGVSNKASFDSRFVVAVGVEGADGSFAGVLQASTRVESLFGQDPKFAFKRMRDASPSGAVILTRGDGDQPYHSIKGPYTENFERISKDYQNLLAATRSKEQGREWMASYDGKPAMLLWRRLGAWRNELGDKSLLNLVLLLPSSDFPAAGAGVEVKGPAPFFARPLAILLLLLTFGLPLVLGLFLIDRETKGLRRTLETASQIDEFGVAPAGLEFREEADSTLRILNQSLNQLMARARTHEDRVKELDAALRRAEDQVSRDATSAAQEISDLRVKLAGAESEKNSASAKHEMAQKAKQEAEIQTSNLKGALETAQRSIDLKNTENKNLSAQIQDLMHGFEEQRKVVEQAQANKARREDEVVRLSAVNTLSAELKATLTVIKSYISTMLGSAGAISDAQQEFLGVVINKSARLERLINDLVELSEVGSGVKPPKLEDQPLSALIQEALLNIRPQADQKRIALEFAESGQVPQVSLDKDRISAVLRALLSQAVKVTSRSEKITLLLSQRENSAELRISDPGMSLPPDRAAKVFAQFHGVDSQAGPEFIGTGLRFPIMRAVIEAHGGKIWIESQVGRGKTFVISLPKAGSFVPVPSLPPAPHIPSMADAKPKAAPAPAEVANFNSIFDAAPKPATPPPTALPPLGAPGGLAALGTMPIAAPAAALVVSPLGPPGGIKPVVVSAPASEPAAPALLGALPKIELKTNAQVGVADKESFDSIFGSPSAAEPSPVLAAAPAPDLKPLPKIELKTNAQVGAADKESFDSIFGGPSVSSAPTVPATPAPKPVGPPPAMGAIPAPPPPGTQVNLGGADLAGFEAIFGGAPAPPPRPLPAAPATPAPKPMGPPPAMGAIPAPPPPGTQVNLGGAELASFDAIFGGAPASAAVAPSPPPAAPAPKPAALPMSGGMDTLDDLTDMIQGS